MKKSDIVTGALILGVVAYLSHYSLLARDNMQKFLKRAEAAESYTTAQSVVIDSLKAHVRVVVQRIPATPAPDTCSAWVKPLQEAHITLQEALARAEASRDSLGAALGSRPKTDTRFVRPNIGFGGFVGLCGINKLCVGVGLTFNLGGIRP